MIEFLAKLSGGFLYSLPFLLVKQRLARTQLPAQNRKIEIAFSYAWLFTFLWANHFYQDGLYMIAFNMVFFFVLIPVALGSLLLINKYQKETAGAFPEEKYWGLAPKTLAIILVISLISLGTIFYATTQNGQKVLAQHQQFLEDLADETKDRETIIMLETLNPYSVNSTIFRSNPDYLDRMRAGQARIGYRSPWGIDIVVSHANQEDKITWHFIYNKVHGNWKLDVINYSRYGKTTIVNSLQ